MTGDDHHPDEPVWHERTSTVVGSSVAAVITLVLLYFAVSCVAREFNSPEQVPQYFLDPGGSTSSRSFSPTTTTSSTITSTIAPQTSDIDPGDTTTTSSKPNATTRSRTPTNDDDTTTRRPRFNETRPYSPGYNP